MKKLWSQPVEQIVFTALEHKTRVIGVTSPTHADSVADLTATMAATFAASGSRTILVDLSQPVLDGASTPPWVPGDGGIGQSIQPTAGGFDLLQAYPTAETRLLFSNADLYRRTFEQELRHYSSILIELPPVINGVMTSINPVGPALACDGVLLMCTTGRSSRSELQGAVDPLKDAGVKLAGIIMNDSTMPTLADELVREARRLRILSPAFSDWLERRLKSISLLNSR